MKKKPNSLLAKHEAVYRAKFLSQLQIAMQMGLDAGMIAANEVLQMGAGRAEEFKQVYIETVNEMARMTVDDAKDDPEFVWAKAKVDERIKKIVGEDKFVPWEERYKV